MAFAPSAAIPRHGHRVSPADLRAIEADIVRMLAEVTGTPGRGDARCRHR